MHIGIIGTRGIPNHYGGFEQFAEYLSLGLAKAGFEVSVYNSHNHPYQKSTWNGVNIIHCFDPEKRMGTIGQFVYDLNCILSCRRKSFDIILQLGYTSSSVWSKLLPTKKSIVTTNMDGLEWKRTKYSKHVQRFLLYAEELAVRYSHHLISDSMGIKKYLKDKYNVSSTYIPYGANIFNSPLAEILNEYGVDPFKYNLLIARLEPENSIEIILDGVVKSKNNKPFLVVGNHNTTYGNYLKNKFTPHSYIKFIGGVYNIDKLNNLRYYSNLYLHGHTVGGTNPSLLEAMASSALICAHNNVFNKSILGEDAFYFLNVDQVSEYVSVLEKQVEQNLQKIEHNRKKIKQIYSWPIVINEYIQHFKLIAS